MQFSDITLNDEESILKSIIYGTMNEPDNLFLYKNKFKERIQKTKPDDFKLNLKDGRIFVYDSYRDDIILDIDYTEL